MNYFDYWESDTADFLKYFSETELDFSLVKNFLERFSLEHYEVSIDLKEAKRILLVYSNSEYTFSATDLSWISDRTNAIVCSFEGRNLIFVDLDSSRDSYYINAAAFIKIFNKAFQNNNCFIFKTCNGLAVGSMRYFDSDVDNNFCITQLFSEDSFQLAIEFIDEIICEQYDKLPSAIINYSPQERYEYIKSCTFDQNFDYFEEFVASDFDEEPIIYTTYKETCDILKHVANEGNMSSFDVLEEALLSAKNSFFVAHNDEEEAVLNIGKEEKFSDSAYADAEQMLKEMLDKI